MKQDQTAIVSRNIEPPTQAVSGVLIRPDSLQRGAEAFLTCLEGRNVSPATLRAYATDLQQFLGWLSQTYSPAILVDEVERGDIEEYLAFLARRGLSGVSRARKLAAIRELFRYLEQTGRIGHSPASGVEGPKRERNGRTYLHPEEYTRMLSLGGANPRDFAILTVFLQTGVRVSELCELRLEDVDLEGRVLRVRHGKGNVSREIALEKKGIQALRSWLKVRPQPPNFDDHLFLNRYGQPISERGVRKLVTHYRLAAGITKKATPHSFRHTFGTLKAEQGVSPYQLREWRGHARLDTTQNYVHMGRKNSRKVMEATSL